MNTIEGLKRPFRKVTKFQSVFPADDSLLKMLYLTIIMDTMKKWIGGQQNWDQVQCTACN